MSDRALVWKFAFGVLVLAFCAVSFLTRKDAGHRIDAVLAPVPAPMLTPLPAASAPPEVVDPPLDATPTDSPGVQDEPVRVRVSARPPQIIKKHHVIRRVLRKVVHGRPHRTSPYVAGRQHYPFDPRERWLSPLG